MTNDEAKGYFLFALKESDVDRKKIQEIFGNLRWVLDMWTEEDALNYLRAHQVAE